MDERQRIRQMQACHIKWKALQGQGIVPQAVTMHQYASSLVGRQVAGYHLHQVVETSQGMINHQPVRDLHGPLISYSSFLWAWRAGQLSHAPAFLEVPDPEGQRDSLHTFRRMLGL